MMLKKPLVTIAPINLQAKTCITQVFQRFSQDNWAMLLDSSNSKHKNGQFDILVANPIATITTKGNKSEIIHYNKEKEYSEENPLQLIQKLIGQYLAGANVTGSVSIPFVVGALGYFGYDLGRQFESLPNKNNDEYNAPDMAIGIYSWSIVKDNHNDKFYLCYLDGYPHPTPSEIARTNLIQLAHIQHQFSLTSPWQANMSKASYKQNIAKIKYYLNAGDCYQTNLAQRFTAKYEGDEWHAYLKLRKENQAPFSAFIRLPKSSILSISPERFLSVKNAQVETKPIKGTRPRQKDQTADAQQIESLLSSEKDRAENLMIVDLLRNDLSKHCEPGSVKVPELFKIETFSAVHHLVSTVTAKLKTDKTVIDLLQGAFPGGSITGAPKIRAMEIIDELEPNNRNIYCGSIGYIGIKGDMDTSICIRTLLCEQATIENKIHCWAGGGIVIDSKAEDEYQESLDKVSKILPILEANLPNNL